MIENKIIDSFLMVYGLEGAKLESIGGGLSNSTSLIRDKNRKYVMKIANKNSNLATEVDFGNFLHFRGIPTAEIIKNRDKEEVTCLGDLCGSLFSFCEGAPITGGDLSESLSRKLAELLTQMHLIMVGYSDIPAKEYRGCDVYPLDGITNIKITEKYDQIKDHINSLEFTGLRTTLVHGDLTRNNILIGEDKKTINAVIDFGDAHYDFIVWDLAVMITHIFITKTYGIDQEALKIFFEEYNRLLPLSREEKNVIIPFIKARNINLAIEVNCIKKTKENAEELLSIENSVIMKLEIIQEAEEELKKIFGV